MSSYEISPLGPKNSLSDDAFETVRQWVISGELAADSILNERSLAVRLGLSRTPVREAVGRLVGEGLLRRSGRAVIVNAVRTEDVFEILSLRRLLEGEAVRLAMNRISKSTLLSLKSNELDLLTLDNVTPADHWRVEDAFHNTIVEASGNQRLARIVAELRERTRLYGFGRIPERLEPGRREHIGILDAMLAGDTDMASSRMQDHLQSVADAIMDSLSSRHVQAHAASLARAR